MPSPRKAKPGRFSQLVERLIAESIEVHSATGSEEAIEITKAKIRAAVDEVWPAYLRHRISEACGIRVHGFDIDADPVVRDPGDED